MHLCPARPVITWAFPPMPEQGHPEEDAADYLRHLWRQVGNAGDERRHRPLPGRHRLQSPVPAPPADRRDHQNRLMTSICCRIARRQAAKCSCDLARRQTCAPHTRATGSRQSASWRRWHPVGIGMALPASPTTNSAHRRYKSTEPPGCAANTSQPSRNSLRSIFCAAGITEPHPRRSRGSRDPRITCAAADAAGDQPSRADSASRFTHARLPPPRPPIQPAQLFIFTRRANSHPLRWQLGRPDSFIRRATMASMRPHDAVPPALTARSTRHRRCRRSAVLPSPRPSREISTAADVPVDAPHPAQFRGLQPWACAAPNWRRHASLRPAAARAGHAVRAARPPSSTSVGNEGRLSIDGGAENILLLDHASRPGARFDGAIAAEVALG